LKTPQLLQEFSFLGAGQVIVTLGGDGSLYVNKEKVIHVLATKVKPIDTTGAGDCYLGSLGYFLAAGCSIKQAMEKASHCAGISVTRLGTQSSYPRKEELPEEFCVDQ